MNTLPALIPDVDVLLALSPEDLAPIVLKLSKERAQNGLVHLQNLASDVQGNIHSGPEYPQSKRRAAEQAISEAWNWLKVNGLIVPDAGMNGSNGFHRLSRRGESIAVTGDFDSFRKAAAFPKSLLHTAIADKVWMALARGELDDAVFTAFKAVEVAVREAGRFSATDVGVALMRKAFDKATGPLSDASHPEAEREALAHLFAGAIGSYKNPHSHRTVSITDPLEAQEQVMLASHLLRIVNAREP